jgi:2-phosphoglycerate kinase
MSRAYLIGGAPRVGKTDLAMQILHKRPMFAVSADSIRDMLQGVLKPGGSPALFRLHELTKNESAMAKFLHTHPQEGVELQNDESAVIWPSVNELVLSHLADGQDILVEGVEILPEYLKDVSYDFRVAFLGNTSPEHANAIAAQAHKNTHDWMHSYTDNTIDGWAKLVRSFSTYIKSEAAAHDMPFLEIHDDNFEQSLAQAERILLDE